MSKKENHFRQIKVYTKMDLEKAMKDQYGIIVIKGEIAQKVVGVIEPNWNVITMAGVLWRPLFYMGILGMFSSSNMHKYQIISVADQTLVLERRKK